MKTYKYWKLTNDGKIAMTDMIDYCLEMLSSMTKEEADYIQAILRWNDEQKTAFFLAKKIFEEKSE